MSGVTDKDLGRLTITVRIDQAKLAELERLEQSERLTRGGHDNPHRPAPQALVEWAVASFLQMCRREK